jgi:hypothetical protein
MKGLPDFQRRSIGDDPEHQPQRAVDNSKRAKLTAAPASFPANDKMAAQLRDANAKIEALNAQVRAYELLHGALEPEDFVSLKAATVTGLKYEKIRRLAAAEEVASRFHGKHRRVSLKSLRAWVAQHSRHR